MTLKPGSADKGTGGPHTAGGAPGSGGAGRAGTVGLVARPGSPAAPATRLLRLEEVARAVGGGYCRLRMPLRLALGVRGAVAGVAARRTNFGRRKGEVRHAFREQRPAAARGGRTQCPGPTGPLVTDPRA